MEKWRQVWREGFMPQFSTEQLESMFTALASDDPRLLQRTTCHPPLLDALRERAVESCCITTWSVFRGGDNPCKVEEVEKRFQELCDWCDAQFNEPAACRFFLNFYDDAPRSVMRQELIPEVAEELKRRGKAVA